MNIRKVLRKYLNRLLDNLASDGIVACVWCDEGYAKVKVPIKPFITVATCSKCNRQILLIGLPDKPYGLNPDILKDDVDLCIYGCHFAEPYGFVPMAGCPIHD